MSNEEFQRKMDFIVEQQAQFVSDMQVLRESQAETDNVVARLAYATLEGFTHVNAKINALVDSQIKNEEKMRLSDESFNARMAELSESQAASDQRFNEKMAQLSEAQVRTEESLRNLIERQDGPRLRTNGGDPEESNHEH